MALLEEPFDCSNEEDKIEHRWRNSYHGILTGGLTINRILYFICLFLWPSVNIYASMSLTDPLLITDIDTQPVPLDPPLDPPPPYPSRQYRPCHSTRCPRIPPDLPEEHQHHDAMRPFPETDHHDM